MIETRDGQFIVTDHGLRHSTWPKIVEEGKPSPEMIKAATLYLEKFWLKASTVRHGSYSLKHRVEHSKLIGYCTNGALIQAALDLGFDVEPQDPLNPKRQINAWILAKPNRVELKKQRHLDYGY